jgi:hypothetical protein
MTNAIFTCHFFKKTFLHARIHAMITTALDLFADRLSRHTPPVSTPHAVKLPAHTVKLPAHTVQLPAIKKDAPVDAHLGLECVDVNGIMVRSTPLLQEGLVNGGHVRSIEYLDRFDNEGSDYDCFSQESSIPCTQVSQMPITCDGCLQGAAGQEDHMGCGGCLEVSSQCSPPFYMSSPPF